MLSTHSLLLFVALCSLVKKKKEQTCLVIGVSRNGHLPGSKDPLCQLVGFM